MNLLDLAPEIVVHVLAYLDFRDVIRTAQVRFCFYLILEGESEVLCRLTESSET